MLEIGCGSGALGTRLADEYDYVGYEPDPESFETARSRLEAVGRGRVVNERLPIQPTRRFDAVCAFEVLEHTEDDAATLAAWAAWLEPGGTLLVSVPAHQHRYGPWDESVGHFRRYSREALVAVFESAGLPEPTIIAVGFPLGYVLEAVRNRLAAKSPATMEEKTAASGRLLQPRGAVGAAIWLGALPFRLIQKPFAASGKGTGFVAWAQKPA